MPARLPRLILALAAGLLLAAPSSFAKDEFEALDDRIVQAYNAEPKRTAEVYALCLEMADLAASKKGGRSDAWLEKSKKLLTLACLNEAMAAQRRRDFKQVYVWCGRGTANGASSGEIGGMDLGEVCSLLSNLQADARRSMDASGESYGSLSMEFRPPSRTDARKLPNGEPDFSEPSSNQGFAPAASASAAGPVVDVRDGGLQKDSTHVQGRLRGGSDGGIVVLDGPRQDRERSLFVKIKTPAGRDVEIVFRKDKGWIDKASAMPVYYETWMKCAEEIIRNEGK